MRNILSINKNWTFIKDSTAVPTALPVTGEKIDLPHTWNAIDGQDGGNDYFRGSCCYVKELEKSELPHGEKYYLEINGANSSADVYMNGKRLAHHDGGYSAWRVEITNTLREKNCLCIIVDNSANDRVYPQIADFTFYGGLYRDVNIIAVSELHFDLDYYGTSGVMITPCVSEGKADVRIDTFHNGANACRVLYRIYGMEGELVCEKDSENSSEVLTINDPHLWNGRKDPYLYTAILSLMHNGAEVDRISVRFGCRSYIIDPERGFILNGEEYPLRGVARHQDRWKIGNALLPCHHEEDMELICEVGANTIRLAHYQHDSYFYDLCDQKGVVVWAEIPYISKHMSTANENAVSQMRELITQNYNHPCIAVWGLSNEITMDGAKDPDLIAMHKQLNDLVHKADPTRPTTLACISMCDINERIVHITDVLSYNHYFGWYGGSVEENGAWFDNFHKKYPHRPIGCSEYGCEALNWHSSNPKQGDYTEEYQAYYHEQLIKQLFSRKYLWATHVWNMFDFGADARAEGGENGQNHKGLVTFDRKYKKDAFYAYKAWLSDEPFVHICGKRYVDRTEDVTRVTVYSNLPEVELFAGGKSLGKKTAPDHFFYFDVPNVGQTKLEAIAGEYRDSSFIQKVDRVNQDYILREQGAVLNWFDITETEGRYSLNDTIGDIMKSARGKLWCACLLMSIAKKQKGTGTEKMKKSSYMNKGALKMVNGFTVLRLTGMLGMINISFTKEELLRMNAKLNRIKKPKNL
ncbi:MAG: glycoside hydrolase family 2 protein [Clostridia bacterium]|nr:glycoside hydrolase family 2 protein [Clostridia bacterium]